jgi:hypothetical protein
MLAIIMMSETRTLWRWLIAGGGAMGSLFKGGTENSNIS